MIKEQFDKNMTNIIKGIMLTFMFILHFFTMPEEYVAGVSYPNLVEFSIFWNKPLDICVPVFAFLTGYFYHYCSTKNYRYSMKKVKQILIPYWMVYVVLLLIGLITHTYVYKGGKKIILELLALYRPVMWFCWYVAFYIVSMMLLPMLAKFSDNFLVAIVSGMILPYGIGICVNHFLEIPVVISRVIADVSTFYPVVSMGYICSKFDIFEMIDRYVLRRKRTIVTCVVSGVILFILFIGQYYIAQDTLNTLFHGLLSLCLYYASIPLFVFGLVIFINCWKIKNRFWILREIGKKSMYMWFIHSIFFNCSKEIFQPILYWPKNPVLVVLWGLIICWCAAWGFETVYKKLFVTFYESKK